jgi:hypothetical protein
MPRDLRQEIGEHDVVDFLPLITGRTITAFEMEPSSRHAYADSENYVTITFDNGAVLHFSGAGDPGSWLVTSYTPPPD